MHTQSRTIRVFLSSTFRDFAEERDLLVRKVFPELRRKCRERQVELVDVDLRWGITEKEAQQGKVLPICLAEVDRSRPWFMGFIGERYGWVPAPEQFDPAIVQKQPWLEEHRGGKSVTELEILHGVLNNPKMAGRAFFYFRDSKWSNKKGGSYLSEGSEEKVKLEELKERIRQSGFPVLENYPNPEALAERVKEDLWKLIDEAYPESEVPDALTQERMRHEAFASSRLGLYIGGQKYFEALDALISSEPRKPILLCGASGVGKSALLANWVQKYCAEYPKAIVLTHFLSTGADAAYSVNMAIRLLREISLIIGEELVLEGDPRKALRMLEPWLGKAGAFAHEKGCVFVLVLDAIDKMTDYRDLDWWPRCLPEGVAIVASCLDGGLRDSLQPKMEWTEVCVSPLAGPDCETFIQEHLAKYRKSLTPEQTAEVLGHPLSGNPLFLRTLLEELRVFGVHEELNLRIAHYLASETMDDLFENVLERVESDNTPKFVRAALQVLWAAKESFAEDELLTVSQLPPAVWASISIALDESIIGAGGRLAFSHDYLRKAVEDRYLPDVEDKALIKRAMAEFCAQAMAGGRKETSSYVRRNAVEHFLEAEDWDAAAAALSDLEFIEARAIAQELSAMLRDYHKATLLLPEGEKERQTEAARRAELDRYAKEMVNYAATWSRIRGGSGESEPQLPRPVKSVLLWPSEGIADERKRMTETPHPLDKLRAFQVFVATNAAPLQSHSSMEGFVANLARNDAPAGPVHEEGKRRLGPMTCIKLIKRFATGEGYNPLPACQAILEGHTKAVSSVALSADGRRAVSGSDDNTLRLWDLDSGECLKVLEGHTATILSVALSADGRRAVSGSDENTLRLWDLDSGECLKVIEGHTATILSVALSADGCRAVSGGMDNTLRLWDLDSGECLKVLEGHAEWVLSVVLSADGRRAVSGSRDNTLRLWDLDSGDCLKVLEGHGERVLSVALNVDGRRAVSGSGDCTLRLWDLDSGECPKVLEGHTKGVSSVALSADGRRAVSGSRDNTLRLWDLDSGECLKVLEGHGERVLSVALSVDGRRAVSGSLDDTLRLWNLDSGECLNVLDGHTAQVDSVTLSADGHRAVSGSWDYTLRLWDLDSGECIQVIEGHTARVSSVALSADGRRAVSGRMDNTLRLWDLDSGECLKVLEGHAEWVSSVVLSADGRRAVSGSRDNTVRLWDLDSGKCLKVLAGHTEWVSSVVLSANGRCAVSGSGDCTLRLWDLDSGDCLKVLEDHAATVSSVALSADGRHAISGSGDCSLRLWDLDSGECLKVLEGHAELVLSVVLSADGRRAVSGSSDETLRLWDLESGECLSKFYVRGFSALAPDLILHTVAFGFYLGQVELFNLENLPLAPLISTAHREILTEDLPASAVITRTPCCGQLISISNTIADRIEHWTRKGGNGGYTDPALLLGCPQCKTPLRMNPFFGNEK